MSPSAQLDLEPPSCSPGTPYRVVYLGARDLRADPAPLEGWGLDLALTTPNRTGQRYRLRVAARYMGRRSDPSNNEPIWRTLAYLGARQIEERTTSIQSEVHAHRPEPIDLFPLVALARRLARRVDDQGPLRPGQTLLDFEIPARREGWRGPGPELHSTLTRFPEIGVSA
jgi:hypothetical protein